MASAGASDKTPTGDAFPGLDAGQERRRCHFLVSPTDSRRRLASEHDSLADATRRMNEVSGLRMIGIAAEKASVL